MFLSAVGICCGHEQSKKLLKIKRTITVKKYQREYILHKATETL